MCIHASCLQTDGKEYRKKMKSRCFQNHKPCNSQKIFKSDITGSLEKLPSILGEYCRSHNRAITGSLSRLMNMNLLQKQTFSAHVVWEQGWRSGESARLPPMCPGFDSRTRHHMWVEFVVGSRPSSEGFSPGSPVFPPPQKSTFLNSNSIGNSRAPGLSVEDCYVLPSLNIFSCM